MSQPAASTSASPAPYTKLSTRFIGKRSEEHTSELQSHSDLHSFPTRRSSDLGCNRRCRRTSALPCPRRGTSSGCPGSRGSCARRPRTAIRDSPGRCPSPLPRRRPRRRHTRSSAPGSSERDRKSTRLNSSHTVIYTLSLHDALPISVVIDAADVLRRFLALVAVHLQDVLDHGEVAPDARVLQSEIALGDVPARCLDVGLAGAIHEAQHPVHRKEIGRAHV